MSNLKKVIALALILICSLSLGASERPVFALVLSGGGARGIAHIAVIEELEKRGIVPDMVIGTSIGALIGGFYSAGYTAAEIQSKLLDTDIMALMTRLNNKGGSSVLASPDSRLEDNIISLNFSDDGIGSNNGLLDDQELGGFFRKNLAKVLDIEDFDKLSIPFRAIGIDAVTGEEIIFSSGSLYTALRSSMSLPIIFAPVKTEDGRFVMDGGIVNNLPVDVALDMGADYVLAVDVNDAFNRNHKLSSGEMETFSGTFDAFTQLISTPNSRERYELADWILTPSVNEFSTVGFDEKNAILERGRINVAENQNIFDEISAILEGREENEFTLYSSRLASTIEGIDYAGLDRYSREFNEFLGKPINEYTMQDFEKLLRTIGGLERIEHISYRIKDGIITLIPSHYVPSTGLAIMGLSGDAGLKYDGTYRPYFSFAPFLSAGVGTYVNNQDYVSLGIIFDDTISLEARYSKHIFDKGFFYSGADLKYLNLSYNTIGTVYGNASRSDFGATLSCGLFYNPHRYLQTDIALEVDYYHLARLLNHNDYNAEDLEHSTDINAAYIKGEVMYDSTNREDIFSSGINLDFIFSLGLDYAYSGFEELRNTPLLSYDMAFRLEYIYNIEGYKGILEVEADCIRRYPKLAEAYRVTKAGIRTPDYLFFHNGTRGTILSSSYHYCVGPYVEIFKRAPLVNSDYYTKRISSVPFSTLNALSLGIMGSVGTETDFGEVYVELGMGFADKFSAFLSIGIR